MEFTDYLALSCFGLFVLGGLALILSGSKDLRLALASSSWPSVAGVIRKCEVSARTTSRSSRDGGSTMYFIELSAGYLVDGKDYRTGNVHYGFSGGSGDASAIKIEQLRYPVGAPVQVYYYPQNPAQAVLRPGFTLDLLGAPLAGVVLFLTGVMFTLVYLGAFKDYPVLPLGFRFFSLIFLLAGIAMLVVGSVRLKSAHDSRDWPRTTGRIVYAAEHSSTSQIQDSEGGVRPVTSFSAPLAYRYEVGGKTYYSNIRRFGALAGASQDWAQSILEQYPAGAQAPVYHHPADANSAVLEPGITSEAFWVPGAGLGFLLFGLAAWFISSRM